MRPEEILATMKAHATLEIRAEKALRILCKSNYFDSMLGGSLPFLETISPTRPGELNTEIEVSWRTIDQSWSTTGQVIIPISVFESDEAIKVWAAETAAKAIEKREAEAEACKAAQLRHRETKERADYERLKAKFEGSQ
jgi:hypothetical protein